MQTTSQHSLTKRIILHTKEGYTYGVVHFLNREHTTPDLLSAVQEIIDPAGSETFGKEPELVKLLRELKSTPVSYNKKKNAGFSRMSVMANLLCFGSFDAG